MNEQQQSDQTAPTSRQGRLGAVVLSVAQMYDADRMTMQGGVEGKVLMSNAGAAVADAIVQRWSPRSTVVLCGPGNNGGDGFVVARLLALRGWPVRLALLGDKAKLAGDAAHHARLWRAGVEPVSPASLDGAELVVDALFGAGLSRPLEGAVAALADEAGRKGLPVVAVDIPSGVLGDSGEVLGDHAFSAALTVTFCRKKPGHLLQPGQDRCGEVTVADIGIPDEVVAKIDCSIWENCPAYWLDCWPRRTAQSHKYDHGHALVCGGERMTGAARLSSLAALRVGAGLVTVAAPMAAAPVYQLTSPSLIVAPQESNDDFARLLADKRISAVLLGPGAGVSRETRAKALAALSTKRAVVLDADALTVFAERPGDLFDAAGPQTVITPHAGEFDRLFPDLAGNRLERARAAARQSGAVVVFKGSDTIVAAPDGRTTINAHASPNLATAGSGDVLAGLITGLLAQGTPPLEAASAAVWLQGDAALRLGVGMISEDLITSLPAVLSDLLETNNP